MAGIWRDGRYGLRMMRRSPGFTAVAVLSLALGIGANTAIFSLINTMMLRRLPVREPEQLVELLSRYPGEPRMNNFSWKYYEHFRDRNHVFSDLIGTSPTRFQVSGEGFDAEVVDGDYVGSRRPRRRSADRPLEPALHGECRGELDGGTCRPARVRRGGDDWGRAAGGVCARAAGGPRRADGSAAPFVT
jgi:hypothetical protein